MKKIKKKILFCLSAQFLALVPQFMFDAGVRPAPPSNRTIP